MQTIITGVFQQETNRYADGITSENIFQHREYLFGTESIRKFYTGVRNKGRLLSFLTPRKAIS